MSSSVLISAAQLADAECRLADLAHPVHWPAGMSRDMTGSARRVLVSRHLVRMHRLPVLEPSWFDAPWKLAVIGGHEAVRALQSHIGGSLLARWMRVAVSGSSARALRGQLDPDLLRDALLQMRPLRRWQPPAEVPCNVGALLERQAGAALAALWRRHAAMLWPWARVMLDTSDLAAAAEAPASFTDAAIDELEAVVRDEFDISLNSH